MWFSDTFCKIIWLSLVGIMLTGCSGGDSSSTPPPAQPPVASNVTLFGVWVDGSYTYTGQTLTGSYTYSDANNDPEGVSTYLWQKDGAVIAGATSKFYTLTSADLNSFIGFFVTPVAQSGTYLTGIPVCTITNSPITAGIVQGGLAWSDAETGYIYNWADANTYCTTSTINALTGWRLPTISEFNSYRLSSVGYSSVPHGRGYWSSTLGASPSTHKSMIFYSAGRIADPIRDNPDISLLYAVCVR